MSGPRYETPTAPLTLYDFMRMSDVNRWHIINTTRAQTVADHSFRVTVLALHLYKALTPTWGYIHAMELTIDAMFHDAHEVRVGDPPTIAKDYGDNAIGKAYDDIRKLLLPARPLLGDIYPKDCTTPPMWTERYIKMADAIESAVWISQNRAGGHAYGVSNRCWDRVWKLAREFGIKTGQPWERAVGDILEELRS